MTDRGPVSLPILDRCQLEAGVTRGLFPAIANLKRGAFIVDRVEVSSDDPRRMSFIVETDEGRTLLQPGDPVWFGVSGGLKVVVKRTSSCSIDTYRARPFSYDAPA